MSGIFAISDWSNWHDEYENPDSELTHRSRLVQEQVAAAVDDQPPGPVTVVSMCGGQGRELIGALEGHDRRSDVQGRLVELDARNAAFARDWAQAVGLTGLEVREGDASASDNYDGLPRADLVIVSGVFGHLCPDDRRRVIAFLPEICRRGARVVITTYEVKPETTADLRAYFAECEFDETGWAVTPGGMFGVMVHQLRGEARPLVPNTTLFTFGSSRTEQGNATET
ncbi:MAG TPA: class I SAM-dependent methyltransferase family protein [Acidimicrobiales bacterium]